MTESVTSIWVDKENVIIYPKLVRENFTINEKRKPGHPLESKDGKGNRIISGRIKLEEVADWALPQNKTRGWLNSLIESAYRQAHGLAPDDPIRRP